jgi:hypothetical protein
MADAARRCFHVLPQRHLGTRRALIKFDINPDKLPHAALAAELTNHLVDGAVPIPGAAGSLPELQQDGFHYVR